MPFSFRGAFRVPGRATQRAVAAGSIDRGGGMQPRSDRELVARGFRIDRAGARRRRIATVQTMTPKEIRSRRLALGMSVEQLARELGVPSENVREIENGDRPVANARLLEKTFARHERDQGSPA